MKAKDRSLPYPVLSPFRDDVEPNKFEVELALSSDPKNYHLAFKFSLQNPTLLSLVENGDAVHAVHVECRGNFFRKLFRSSSPEGSIAISADDLTGTVEVSFFITAESASNSYTIIGAHSDYSGASFAVRYGDVLAIAATVTFDADKDFDPLKKISSILQICPADDLHDGPFTLDLQGQKLSVFLPRPDYERYAELRGTSGIKSVLIQSIVLPALAETIFQMRQISQEEVESESQPRWFRIIRQRLTDLGEDYALTGKTPLELAQKLLSNPLGGCLKELVAITEGENRE